MVTAESDFEGAGRRAWTIDVVGGGPAGLFAAEILAVHGCRVTVVDRMPNVGRKLLMAGRGGLNLTHSEPLDRFVERFEGSAAPYVVDAVRAFPPHDLISWAEGLGQSTFEGTSGRIFPKAMKASPLLRAWLKRLGDQGVRFKLGARWMGWRDDGSLVLHGDGGSGAASGSGGVDAVVLALGGASWPRLGSDGGWTLVTDAAGVERRAWEPANAGVQVAWSRHLIERHAGAPLKRLGLRIEGAKDRDGAGAGTPVLGEAVLTRSGLEGGAIYAIGHALRRALAENENVVLLMDLRPGMALEEVAEYVARPRGKQSMSNHLRKAVGLPPVAVALLHEAVGKTLPAAAGTLAELIKAVPIRVTGVQPIARAISSAGGISGNAIDAHFMLRARPGVFVAGEMLDWEAPTGGYLLQACFASGRAAALGALRWLEGRAA